MRGRKEVTKKNLKVKTDNREHVDPYIKNKDSSKTEKVKERTLVS